MIFKWLGFPLKIWFRVAEKPRSATMSDHKKNYSLTAPHPVLYAPIKLISAPFAPPEIDEGVYAPPPSDATVYNDQ